MPHISPPIALSTPNQNLVRLTMMRGITWTGFLLVITFGINVLQFHLNVLLVITCIMAMGIINLLTWWRLGRPSAVSDQEYELHLLVDIAGLTLLFALTGGATNPAISYLLVPVTIAAATLRWRSALLIAAVAILSYLLLMFYYVPVPELSRQLPNLPFNLHVIGMGITFLLSTALVIFFISKMALALRVRDRTLARTREAALRSEQILAVASQAAGTAHELGTPLSTISVIVSDMLEDAEGQPQLQEDIRLIKQQVDTCKAHLRTLADSARRQAGSMEEADVSEWFKRVINRWTVMRHDMEFQLDIAKGRAPQIEVDATLEQAMMNLLNNAADADPSNIEIQLYWENQEVIFDIRDHGAGVPLEIADQLGDTFISTHSKGMGIGLFLTHSTLDRFGGSVRLYNHEGGGTLTEVRLPVAYSAL
ncbi:ATP-binding protein [Carnimonas nigrificans]|uniref:ATP-binding protein n=1 Tax=Carnimonas nigrificans TaxID=64323 RepID=UPI0004709AC3|nr:ATP-binding protein [Carnimonas nigrificans]